MEFNKMVHLQLRKQAQGSAKAQSVITDDIIWAQVEECSLSFRAKLQEMGLKGSRVAYFWRSEFEKKPYTHVVIDDKPYRIESTGAAESPLRVKVVISADGRQAAE